MISTYVQWGGGNLKITWVCSDQLPPLPLITSVHGFCFHEGRILLADVAGRGLSHPGGHPEPGETPEACFRRELLEEGCVQVGDCRLIGHVIVDHSENPLWQPGGKYPLVGYQVFYKADITAVLPFVSEYEATRRVFVTPAEFPNCFANWNSVHAAMLETVLLYSR